MLLVDVSKSSIFGTVNQMKNELITEICAVLAFSAINNNDKVGVIFFSSKIELFIPPKKGKKHILRIIRELLDLEPEEQGTNLAEALRYFNNVSKKRSIAFVLSDFIVPEKDYEDPLRIAAKRHDITGIHIYDQAEKELPKVGLIRASDPETNSSIWIDTSSKKERQRYSSFFTDNFDFFKTTFNKSGIDTVSLETNQSYVTELIKFFKKRH